jgi:putative ABC transport system permease protein
VASGPSGTARIFLIEGDEETWVAVERAVAQQLPDHEVVAVQGALWNGDHTDSLWLSDPRCRGAMPDCAWFPEGAGGYTTMLGDVVVVGGETVADAVEPGLRNDVLAADAAGRVVVFGRGALDEAGQVTVQAMRFDGTTLQPLGSVTLPATEIPVPTGTGPVQLPALATIPPALADRLPVAIGTTQVFVGSPENPVTPDQEDRLAEAITALTAESRVSVERGWTDDQQVARLLLLVVGGSLVLVATLTATGLAVADARPDLATLAAIGAAPRTRRLMAMGSAAVIGGTGALLGLLAGLAPGIAVAYPLTSIDYGTGARPLVVIPWDLLAAVAVGVPLLAVVVTGLAVRSRLPMVRRVAA